MICTQDLCVEDGPNRIMVGIYIKYASYKKAIASSMMSSSVTSLKSCWGMLILKTANRHTAVLHRHCPTPHPLNTSDVIEIVLECDSNKRQVIECQFAIHTRATFTQ